MADTIVIDDLTRCFGERVAVSHVRAAGCEWLHVDFESDLEPFYFESCGFRPTPAGLIHLPTLRDS